MTDITWITQSYGIIDGQGAAGDWSISPYDVARIGYTPCLAGTNGINSTDEVSRELYAKAFAEQQSHPGREERTEEFQRLAAHFGMGSRDSMFAETVEEAKMLIAMLDEGACDLPSCEDQLAAAGFALKYPGHETLGNLWSVRIKSGWFDVSPSDEPGKRSVVVRFHGDGARYWHNVVGVYLEQTGQSGTTIYNPSPASVTDTMRIVVAHTIRVMQLRIARGGRFSKPLGKVLKTR